MRNDPRSCERNICNFVKSLKNECKKVAPNTGSCQKVPEQLVESPSGRQHTALSRKGSIITFRGSPLHQHTTRRGPNHRMYAHEDFYGGKAHIPTSRRGRGGGVTSLYKPYRYVLPQRVWFLRRFRLKMGIHFAYFGLESDMVFEGMTGAYEFVVSIPNEK